MFRSPFSRLCVAGLSLLAALPGQSLAAETSSPFYLRDGDRVVFYGDSITEQRLYTTFTEIFVLTRFPELKISFTHSGWGGDRVGGGAGGPIDVRLTRDVLAYKPTVMTIMLGMNDGGYRAYDEGIYQTYTQGYLAILDRVTKEIPDLRLTLIQPSPYDDITRGPGFEGGYNAVLLKFSDFLKKTADERKLALADFNTTVNAVLTKAFATDSAMAQQIIADRVHPGPAGQFIMAKALLKAWNAPALVTSVEIDTTSKKVVSAQETTVSELEVGENVSWQQLDKRLPFPLIFNDPVTELAIKSSDFIESLNQQPLKVTGLKEKAYQLNIDGVEIASFTADQLAAGINLTTILTPMMKQADQVATFTRMHNDRHFFRWREIQVPMEADPDPEIKASLPVIIKAFDRQEAALVAKQREAAQPVVHKYELIPTVLPGTPNLALKKPFVSSNPNPSGWNLGLTDGVRAGSAPNVWASGMDNVFPKDVTIDLEQPASLNTVIVTVPEYGSTKTVEVSLSEDGKNFKKVGSFVSPPGPLRKAIEFAPQSARYVRLTYPDHYEEQRGFPQTYVFTSEVEVYGPAK